MLTNKDNQLVCLGYHVRESIKRLLGHLESHSNLKKKHFIDVILEAYVNRDLYGAGDGNNIMPTRKQRQCPYRMINVLFFAEFAGDFSSVGDTTTRAELDSGDACNNQGFWVRIQAAFKEPHPIYDKMQFPDDIHLTEKLKSPINPGENIQLMD